MRRLLFAFDFRAGNFRRFFPELLEMFSVADSLQQSTAGSVVVLVNQGAIPRQLVRAPPDDAEQDHAQNKCRMNSNQINPRCCRQREAIDHRLVGALLKPDARYQNHGHDEPKHHPTNTADGRAPEKNFDQKKTQASHEQHDQHRANADDQIIGESFVWLGHQSPHNGFGAKIHH